MATEGNAEELPSGPTAALLDTDGLFVDLADFEDPD